MPTAADVRQRVEQADAARIQRRAEAAATVAEQHAARDEAAARLAEADRHLAESVTSAEQHMTRKELAEFVGAKTSDVEQWAAAGTTRSGRRRSGNRSRKRSSSDGAITTSSTASSGTDQAPAQEPAPASLTDEHTPATPPNDAEMSPVSS